MIDTIKFLVPIDNIPDLQKLKKEFQEIKKEDLKTGKVEYAFYSSDVKLGSHNKKIIVRISDNSRYKLGLHIEFSVPKYAKGNNVEMISPHDLEKILEGFYLEISTVINYPLPHFSTWPLYRLDICYNWIFKNLAEATSAMSFIQRIDYPRKQKYVYESSVMYRGSAYTIKFYLKGPEFRKHDLKEIAETSPQKASELQDWANKTLRFEVEFRKTFLESLCGYKPVYLEHITSDSFIEDTLNYYLKDKVFRYLTPRNSTEAQVEEILYSNFSPTKATRLYQFYKDFFVEDGAIKRRIKTGGIHRSTIFRYKKDLKKLGVGFDLPNPSGKSVLEQLIIPSENSKFDLVDFSETPASKGKGEVV